VVFSAWSKETIWKTGSVLVSVVWTFTFQRRWFLHCTENGWALKACVHSIALMLVNSCF
jgi:hypothetical protein